MLLSPGLRQTGCPGRMGGGLERRPWRPTAPSGLGEARPPAERETEGPGRGPHPSPVTRSRVRWVDTGSSAPRVEGLSRAGGCSERAGGRVRREATPPWTPTLGPSSPPFQEPPMGWRESPPDQSRKPSLGTGTHPDSRAWLSFAQGPKPVACPNPQERPRSPALCSGSRMVAVLAGAAQGQKGGHHQLP